jgi:excisionase family DNA binding protein
MKRTLLSVKELAQELGISTDSVYRAYRTGEIPGAQIARIIRFDLGRVLRAMEERTNAKPNSQCTKRAIAGARRRRAAKKRPRTVKRGLV